MDISENPQDKLFKALSHLIGMNPSVFIAPVSPFV